VKHKLTIVDAWLPVLLALGFVIATAFSVNAAVLAVSQSNARDATMKSAIQHDQLCGISWFAGCLREKDVVATADAYEESDSDSGTDTYFDVNGEKISILNDDTDLKDAIKKGSLVRIYIYNDDVVAQASGSIIVCNTSSIASWYIILALLSVIGVAGAVATLVNRGMTSDGSTRESVWMIYLYTLFVCVIVIVVVFFVAPPVAVVIMLLWMAGEFLWKHPFTLVMLLLFTSGCLVKQLIQRRLR
jgi:hypothetical protein